MSRTATATPPPPLFQHKNSTPSMRHASKGNIPSRSELPSFQRHFKKQPKSSNGACHPTSPLKEAVVAPMSASDMLGITASKTSTPDPMATIPSSSIAWRDEDTDTASIATSVPSISNASTVSDPILATPEGTPSSSIYYDRLDVKLAPSESFSAITAAPSPRSWVNGIGKMARGMIPFGRRRDGDSPRLIASPVPTTSPAQPSPVSPYIAPSPSSIAPSSAVISPMAFMITPSPDVTDMLDNPLPPHALPAAVAHPHNMPPALTPDSPSIENPSEALRRYEWSEAQRRQVTEFARLCSQWPQSSYNRAKLPPGTHPVGQYVPQSWANPRHVVRTMQRQSDLERHLCEHGGTFHPCNLSTRSSTTDVESLHSGPSAFSDPSRESSLATTVSLEPPSPQQDSILCDAVWAASRKCHGPEATEPKTAAAIHAAMSSPMVEAWRGDASIISVSSVSSVASIATANSADESKPSSAWASLANSTKSLSELDKMAELATTDKMDVDEPEPLSTIPSIPGSHPVLDDLPVPTRTLSCPAKRPLTFIADDDDKRRRVLESMAVDDTDAVFTEEPAALIRPVMSASTPSLPSQHPTMIGGYVVKTSDTHPLVISPFIPSEILSTLGKYLIAPTHGREQVVMLGSEIDVPSLLLSCAAANQCPSEAGPVGQIGGHGGPKTVIFNPHRPMDGARCPTNLGNLLLSSCPGKRLRMDGPVKGRGPVCRDLATDMRRIKNAGTDAIVCCLDDEELRLLGVPWEQYRETAAENGIDVIRLPMPDGFTPVSLQLFDAQVSLIVSRYTLKGINVLVHCRGGIGRAGLTACAWAIKMGFVQPHPSLALEKKTAQQQQQQQHQSKRKSKTVSAQPPAMPAQEEERAIVMSIVERSIAMIRSRRGLKAIETMEQVQFLATYVTWLRESI